MTHVVETRARTSRTAPIVGGVLLTVGALGLALWGIAGRAKALAVVTQETRELAVPTVAVITPQRGRS